MCAGGKGPEVFASSEGLGSVALCDCGTVSLHVQAMSLRMDLKAFEEATAMMLRALKAMEQRALTVTAVQAGVGSALLH